MYLYTEPFAFALRSLKEIELWFLLKNGILPSENSVGKRNAHVNLTELIEAIPYETSSDNPYQIYKSFRAAFSPKAVSAL